MPTLQERQLEAPQPCRTRPALGHNAMRRMCLGRYVILGGERAAPSDQQARPRPRD